VVRRDKATIPALCALLLSGALWAALRPGAGARQQAGPPTGLKPDAGISIDYPEPESIFPPEFPPPQFEWRDEVPEDTAWRIGVTFADGAAPLLFRSNGERMRIGAIDPDGIAETNRPPTLTPQEAAAHTWRPEPADWETIKLHSVRGPARIAIEGYTPADPDRLLSLGRSSLRTSADPVGAPVFYRDVPLIPFEGTRGVINPLPVYAVPLIQWKLRDLSRTSSRVLLSKMPTCANCHSFSRDGKYMGIDVDGPMNDKGLYAFVPLRRATVINESDLIKWNARGEIATRRFGFMSQVSPDGQYLVTSMEGHDALGRPLEDRLYNAGYKNFGFGQVFFPTRGILGWYSRATGKLQPLPGADDPRFVQTSAVWSPDGKYLVFLRAEAREPYPAGRERAEYANDPNETQIQYDLHRIPFNDGKGGTPEPIPGAGQNGMSNSFAKISPDGKWIVFVPAHNGLLMRPDSELYIIPAQGGTARRLHSNAAPMNSWHSWSPNGRWLVFSSKRRSPYTQMYLTHIDEDGNDSPALLVENTTASNRAVNIPEFVNIAPDQFTKLEVPVAQFYGACDRAAALAAKGQIADAIAEWRKALAMSPADDRANHSLGALLMLTGRLTEAQPLFEQALRTNPDYPNANADLGVVLAAAGQMQDAIPHFERELTLRPDSAYAHSNYARALAQFGWLDEAIVHFRKAAEAEPNDASVHTNLGRALAMQRNLPAAIAEFERAVQANPNFSTAHHYLGDALYFSQGRTADALAHWREVLRLDPDNLTVLAQCAWALSTDPDPALRNGALAVEYAEHASRLREGRAPVVLDALAAAYAETGRFPDAVQAARSALDLALEQNNTAMADALRAKIAQYEAGRPMRADPPSSGHLRAP
jgi:tetratricopeptide (TPR) repeat protein